MQYAQIKKGNFLARASDEIYYCFRTSGGVTQCQLPSSFPAPAFLLPCSLRGRCAIYI